jgi:chromosome segregation ATPase
MADTSEVITAAGTAITGIVVAGIAAWKGGRRTERRQHRDRSEPRQHSNGAVVEATAEMLQGSTEALASERKAREHALEQVSALTKICASQGAEITQLKNTMQHQEAIIAELTATIALLKARIDHLESRST